MREWIFGLRFEREHDYSIIAVEVVVGSLPEFQEDWGTSAGPSSVGASTRAVALSA